MTLITDQAAGVLRRFQFTDLVSNSNKYYQLRYAPDGATTYRVEINWGRVGDKSQQQVKVHQSMGAIERLVASKLAKGYHEVDLHRPTATAATVSALDSTVATLVRWVFDQAGERISSYLQGRVDALSQTQIGQARTQLAAIQAAHSRYRTNPTSRLFTTVTDAVTEFYRLIPTKLPRRIQMEQQVKDFCSDLAEQAQRLDQLEAAIATIVAPGLGIDGQYQALGVTITALDAGSDDYKRLKREIERRYNHGFTMRVTQLYQIDNPSVTKAFEACKVGKSKIDLLYHGSGGANWRHILHTGLRMPSEVGVRNGSMFGRGLYFASQSTKSGQYCAGGYRGLQAGQQYGLLLCEVAVGRQYIAPGPCSLTAAPNGYDSLWAKAGHSRVVNDEFVVYTAAQHRPKYFALWEMA